MEQILLTHHFYFGSRNSSLETRPINLLLMIPYLFLALAKLVHSLGPTAAFADSCIESISLLSSNVTLCSNVSRPKLWYFCDDIGKDKFEVSLASMSQFYSPKKLTLKVDKIDIKVTTNSGALVPGFQSLDSLSGHYSSCVKGIEKSWWEVGYISNSSDLDSLQD